MKQYLILISILFLSISSHAQAFITVQDGPTTYSVHISFTKADFSGIFIVRDKGNEIVGTLVNEFGIKAFDFSFDKSKSKCKLLNVIQMMDKWYIRRIIGADLSVLFRDSNTKKQLKRRRITKDEDIIEMLNIKTNIRYKIKPLHETNR